MNYSFDFTCFSFKIIRMIDAVLIQARTDGHPQRERQIGQNFQIFNKVISLNLLFSLSFYANFE